MLTKRNINRAKARGFKQKCLDYKNTDGCEICRYYKCIGALEFHHIDPEKKLFGPSRQHSSPSFWPEVMRELDKCMVLCSNCHKEYHYGALELPSRPVSDSKTPEVPAKVFVPIPSKDGLGGDTERQNIIDAHTKSETAEMIRREEYRDTYRHVFPQVNEQLTLEGLAQYD